MSYIMLHKSHPMLDMTVGGKKVGQIIPHLAQWLIFFMDGSYEAHFMYELYRLPNLLSNY